MVYSAKGLRTFAVTTLITVLEISLDTQTTFPGVHSHNLDVGCYRRYIVQAYVRITSAMAAKMIIRSPVKSTY